MNTNEPTILRKSFPHPSLMKPLIALLIPSLLGACASEGPITARESSPALDGLTLVRLEPHVMEVRLDDSPYIGDWRDSRCFTDACRGEFRNVRRIYRRHIRHGEAQLVAQDGTSMQCAWVNYRKQIRGTCRAPDGLTYRLVAWDA